MSQAASLELLSINLNSNLSSIPFLRVSLCASVCASVCLSLSSQQQPFSLSLSWQAPFAQASKVSAEMSKSTSHAQPAPTRAYQRCCVGAFRHNCCTALLQHQSLVAVRKAKAKLEQEERLKCVRNFKRNTQTPCDCIPSYSFISNTTLIIHPLQY